ncbi:bifunctional metallophosphatase/5'-nucleotidase [Paraflavitalea speifideaquila]|uniref:bifunctional metallophosphatase/5'-nucleotidase n=1 Tax=Paraflavitalea speifideaquila TaxID=3076558 RepID=UPI0028E1AF0C|nr:bifunctional metallophosphatase/5'-nucleotidase [Paraflavitalea speifideiaquila]
MKHYHHPWLLRSLLFILFHTAHTIQASAQKTHTFTILQVNDVYEISPLANGKEGGMARVAAIRNQLHAKDPNLITVLSGDFLSPSFIGTLKYKDATGNELKIAGKQMVEVMNSAGIDLVTFGNHEFDIAQADLQRRIDESRFDWINSNVYLVSGGRQQPFTKTQNNQTSTIPSCVIRNITFPDGQSVRVGFIGCTVAFNKNDYVAYSDEINTFQRIFDSIQNKCDIVLGLTHLSKDVDSTIATKIPGLHLIMGGHEHEHMKVPAGKINVCKADANAKSAYIHTISYTPATKQVSIQSDLKLINETVPFDETTNAVVNKWVKLADSIMRKNGFDPQQKLMTATVPLDGREHSIRNHPTNYTELIARALIFADPSVDAAFYNSGSLRVDDELSGDITQYDVLRSLPFGGPLVAMTLYGKQLDSIITIGTTINKGEGGYLQLANIIKKRKGWYIKGRRLKDHRSYCILLPEFMALGGESNLGFIKNYSYCKPNAFHGNQLPNDLRNIVMAYMLASGGK